MVKNTDIKRFTECNPVMILKSSIGIRHSSFFLESLVFHISVHPAKHDELSTEHLAKPLLGDGLGRLWERSLQMTQPVLPRSTTNGMAMCE